MPTIERLSRRQLIGRRWSGATLSAARHSGQRKARRVAFGRGASRANGYLVRFRRRARRSGRQNRLEHQGGFEGWQALVQLVAAEGVLMGAQNSRDISF